MKLANWVRRDIENLYEQYRQDIATIRKHPFEVIAVIVCGLVVAFLMAMPFLMEG